MATTRVGKTAKPAKATLKTEKTLKQSRALPGAAMAMNADDLETILALGWPAPITSQMSHTVGIRVRAGPFGHDGGDGRRVQRDSAAD